MSQLGTTSLARQAEILEYVVLVSPQDYYLPSTGIVAGTKVTIINKTTTNMVLTIRADNGSAIDTIRKGRCVLYALQDEPTLTSHWAVDEAYEEGTWTPTLGGSTTDPVVTYGTQSGIFFRRNEFVHIQFEITWTTHSSAGSGTNAVIRGLPYTISSNNTTEGSVNTQYIAFSTNTALTCSAANGGSFLVMRSYGSDAPNSSLGGAAWTAHATQADTKRCIGQVTYKRA